MADYYTTAKLVIDHATDADEAWLEDQLAPLEIEDEEGDVICDVCPAGHLFPEPEDADASLDQVVFRNIASSLDFTDYEAIVVPDVLGRFFQEFLRKSGRKESLSFVGFASSSKSGPTDAWGVLVTATQFKVVYLDDAITEIEAELDAEVGS